MGIVIPECGGMPQRIGDAPGLAHARVIIQIAREEIPIRPRGSRAGEIAEAVMLHRGSEHGQPIPGGDGRHRPRQAHPAGAVIVIIAEGYRIIVTGRKAAQPAQREMRIIVATRHRIIHRLQSVHGVCKRLFGMVFLKFT